MPAVFFEAGEWSGRIAQNYNMRGQFIVVQRIVPRILMKSGETEIVITNNKVPKCSGPGEARYERIPSVEDSLTDPNRPETGRTSKLKKNPSLGGRGIALLAVIGIMMTAPEKER